MTKVYYYPHMIGLGAYYANDLNDKNLSQSSREFIQSEIKRMAALNFILAEVLLKSNPKKRRKSWAIELETHILRQVFSKKELNLMNREQKRSELVRLLFPQE